VASWPVFWTALSELQEVVNRRTIYAVRKITDDHFGIA